MNYNEITSLTKWLKAIGVTTMGQVKILAEKYKLTNNHKLLNFALFASSEAYSIIDLL